MKINIEIKNKDLKVVEIKEYEFQNYFDYLANRTTSLLYLAEEHKLDLIGHDVLKKAVLDLAGHLKRLPSNLKFYEDGDD